MPDLYQSALPVNVVCPNDTYSAVGIVTGQSIAANATLSLGYLFHPASVNRRYEIKRIVVGNSGNNQSFTIRVTRITTEAAVPGGNLITPIQASFEDPNSNAIIRTIPLAPTRASSDFAIRVIAGSSVNNTVFDFSILAPLVCRTGVAEGWDVRLVADGNAISGLRAILEFNWTEQ